MISHCSPIHCSFIAWIWYVFLRKNTNQDLFISHRTLKRIKGILLVCLAFWFLFMWICNF